MKWLSIFLIFFSFINFIDISAEEKHEIPNITIKNLSMETEKAIIKDANNSFYLVKETATYFVNLNLDVDMGKYTYINQKIKSIVGNDQFRYIQYDLELGVKPFRGIDLYDFGVGIGAPEHLPYQHLRLFYVVCILSGSSGLGNCIRSGKSFAYNQ